MLKYVLESMFIYTRVFECWTPVVDAACCDDEVEV